MKSITRTLMAGVLAGLFAASLHADISNKWRLEFSGNAESDGELGISVLQVGAVVADVSVPIVKGTAENDVARRVRDELQLKLPKGGYSVELDDGEDVLVKRQPAMEDFEIRVVRNSVSGVRIDTDRE